METFLQDVRYAIRGLLRSPGFALAAVFSMALGIGANTAVFSLIDRVLIRSLPVAQADSLVRVTAQRPDGETANFSYPFYSALRDSGLFQTVLARAATVLNAVDNGQVMRLRGDLVSGNYFDSLGVKPAMGRTFLPDEDRSPGTHPVAVLSYAFWQGTFGLSPDIVGTTIRIHNAPYTVVGIAGKGFSGTTLGHPVDVWIPMMMQAQIGRDHLNDRTNWLEIIGRLKEGVTTEQAEAAISLAAMRLAGTRAGEATSQQQWKLVSAGNASIRGELATAFTVLYAITGLAILLACSNVGNLLLARSVTRAKEISVRMALGAGHGRLVRQFLVESLTLALLGGAVALAIAPWAGRILALYQPDGLFVETGLDGRVMIYAMGASLLAGAVLGLAPILALRGLSITQVWSGDRGVPGGRIGRFHAREGLVVVQIAISLVMLISATLLLQSLASLRSVNPGFRVDNLLLVSLDPGSAGYEGARLRAFWDEALRRVRALPGTTAATLARTTPLAPGRQRQHIFAAGFNENSGRPMEIDSNFVGPHYFRTLDIPLLRGRDFEDSDRMESPLVVIVNEGVAKMVWPNQDPVGKRMRVGSSQSPLMEVVAVVKDARYRNLRDEPLPMVYRPIQQTGSSDMMTIHIRAADPDRMADLVRQQLRTMDSQIPIVQLQTFEEQLDSSLSQTRQAAGLSGAFGILALILSATGVYGLTAFAVSMETRGIGIRLALGASPSTIAGMIARRGLSLLVAGLMLGICSAYAVTRIYATLLFGVGANDGITFAATAGILALVALAAMVIPVRAATRLDPLVAIRHE